MLSQQSTISNITDFTSMPRGRIIEVLLKLVEQCLVAFPLHLRSCNDYDETATELFFNNEFSHTFQIQVQKVGFSGCTFHDESANTEDLIGKGKKKGIPPRVDLGIRLCHSRNRIMVIEGKRLHDPSDRQYVSGKTGGISRFKQEQHGADVEVACMVGYVQTNTFPFWHGKINSWIQAAKEKQVPPNSFWDDSDSLSTLYEKEAHLTYCTSYHRRISKAGIQLRHFWVKVV